MSKDCFQLITILYCCTALYFAITTSQKVASGIDDSSNNISFKKNYNNTDEAALDSIYSVNQLEPSITKTKSIATSYAIPDQNELADAQVAENLYDGDMKFSMFRNARGKKWPKSKNGLVYVPYEFDKVYTKYELTVMRKAMAAFTKHTCIRFIPRRTQKDYLSIISGACCWSYVGRISSKQLLSLTTPGCVSHGTIQHELIHALGFGHEHLRSDRDSYIYIPPENFDGPHPFFKEGPNSKNLVIYDYGSVMHYGSFWFAKRFYLPSMEIYPPRNPEPSFGMQVKMSAYDIEKIKYYYGCGSNSYTRCGRDFKDQTSGSFRSPGYPKHYPKDAHCTWTITVRPGRFIKLTITNIDILTSTLCQSHALVVHNGYNANALVEKRICGYKSKIVITSRGRSLFVIFTSGSYGGAKGFTASFAEVTTQGKPPPPIPTLPTVPIMKNLSTSFQCNFDANICGMTQDKTDKANFILHRWSTRNRGTGPLRDHTTGRGKYLYFNGNVGTRYNAIIRTPWFKRQYKYCIKFNYHMYGASMGGLRVYAFEKKKSIKHGERKFLWEKLDDQKNKWHVARITYTPHYQVEQMQFYWEAIASGYTSVIAIDDVVVSPGKCVIPPPPQIVYKTSRCNFERNLCGFLQSPKDKFNWSRNKGATPSMNTGPVGDHSSGKGYYMFIESSAPRRSGDSAVLESPALAKSYRCFTMWYHMYGKNIGKLAIYQEVNGVKIKLIEINGDKGNRWQKLSVQANGQVTKRSQNKMATNQEDLGHNLRKTVPKTSNILLAKNSPLKSRFYMKFIIEATVGSGSKGDIAIDDIDITDKRCTVPFSPKLPTTRNPPTAIAHSLRNHFSCNFDSRGSICGITQMTKDNFNWTPRSGSTPSVGTGPTYDNTKKTKEGFYVYIEGSSPQKSKDFSNIITPKLKSGSYCVRFAYHMFGTQMGSLSVFLLEPPLKPVQLWRNSGNQGNRWHLAKLDFEAQKNTRFVQLIFRGEIGTGYKSDIALDDIDIRSGRCDTPTTKPPLPTHKPTTTTPVSHATVRPPPNNTNTWSGMPLCTFESKPRSANKYITEDSVLNNPSRDLGAYVYPETISNNILCGWFQFRTYDNFDWTRHSGSTPSLLTGPQGDKTTGKGHYMYIESSLRNENDVAFLQTYFMPVAEYCLDLNYHMFGRNMGQLSIRTVQRLKNGQTVRPALKIIRGSDENKWKNMTINYNPGADVESVAFRLEGIVGNGSKSDIAVDDIAILPGSCNACQNSYHGSLPAGCVHTELFWVRCCNSSKPKAIYRRVKGCTANMFQSSRLSHLCQE